MWTRSVIGVGAASHSGVGESHFGWVDFFLEDLGDRTRLRLVESGFDRLPDEIAHETRKENFSGWGHELNDLTSYLHEAGAE